jgi:hypothetical protein
MTVARIAIGHRTRSLLVALALPGGLAVALAPAGASGSTAAGFSGPSEKTPIQCSETPTGQWPEPEGLSRAGACLIQGVGGLTIAPKVVRAGETITATMTDVGQAEERQEAKWGWSGFVGDVGGGRSISGCGEKSASCTVRASAQAASNTWEVFSHAVGFGGLFGGTSYSSDYFNVVSCGALLSGAVTEVGGPHRQPAVGVRVQARGSGGVHTAETGGGGAYSLCLTKGRYEVTVPGKHARPRSRTISLTGDRSGVDFKTGCLGSPTFKLVRVHITASTFFGFEGKHWDTADCGPVSVTAATQTGATPLKSFHSSSFKGRIDVKGRACGLKLYAQQQNGREREVTDTLGPNIHAAVVLADPGPTPSGEVLFPGDLLCRSDVGAQATAFEDGTFTAQNVSAAAQSLGQHLLEIQGAANTILADPAGKVAVAGVSGEGVDPGQVGAIVSGIASTSGVAALTSSAGDETISSRAVSGGSVTIAGNLTLAGGVVAVKGDLTVSGSISGTGAVIATGNITASGGAMFQSDDKYGLVAGGRLNLP